REIFVDERNARLYGPVPFLAARGIPDILLMRIIPSLVFGGILFRILGYQHHTLPAYLAVIVLFSADRLCPVSVHTVFYNAKAKRRQSSKKKKKKKISFNFFDVLMLYSGIFIQNQTSMPWIVMWPKYLSFYNQAFEILFVNEMHGLTFSVTNADVTVGGTALDTSNLSVQLSGDFFISFFGLKRTHRGRDAALLVTWLFLYFIIGILALHFLHRSKR
ncbi:scarlet protein, partial [Reticulomyxa filosa]